jgi:hypothetical protein
MMDREITQRPAAGSATARLHREGMSLIIGGIVREAAQCKGIFIEILGIRGGVLE